MSEPASLIMLQFLTWVADRPRTREQAVEAWHSCPHISVWEDAIVDGLVRTENDGQRTIALTSRGAAVLESPNQTGGANCLATASMTRVSIGSVSVGNTAAIEPSLPMRYLWKFHFGVSRGRCTAAHL